VGDRSVLPSLARRAILAARFTAAAVPEWRLPFRSPAAIARAQRRRIRATVAHAYEHVPYYRETMRRLALVPSDLRTAADLAKLPLIEREQLQRDPEYFVSRAQPLASYVEIHTSGSTGEPVTFFRHVPGVRQQALGHERMEPMLAGLSGKRWRRREALLVPPGNRTSADNGGSEVQWLGVHLRVICGTFSLFESPAAAAPRIERFHPDLIRGYGSYIEALYAHLLAQRRPIHRPKVVIFVADPISDAVRRMIREELGIPVLSLYQAIETGIVGWECEHQRGHHLNVDLCPIRIVGSDRREVTTGKSGEVVVSNLVNRGTVLLNYLLGDLARLLPERCECRRSLPLLSQVEGRSTDWLWSASGRPMHPATMREILRGEVGVRRYQLVQERPGHVRVIAVAGLEANQEEIRARVVAEARRLDDPIEAEVEFSETLPRTQGGKVRTFVTREVGSLH
jgi:phenylacetate-CoA ligase